MENVFLLFLPKSGGAFAPSPPPHDKQGSDGPVKHKSTKAETGHTPHTFTSQRPLARSRLLWEKSLFEIAIIIFICIASVSRDIFVPLKD